MKMYRKCRLKKKLWQIPTRSQVRHLGIDEEPTCPASVPESSHDVRDSLGDAVSTHLHRLYQGNTTQEPLGSEWLKQTQQKNRSKLTLSFSEKGCATSSFLLGSGLCICSSSKKQQTHWGARRSSKKLESPAATWRSTVWGQHLQLTGVEGQLPPLAQPCPQGLAFLSSVQPSCSAVLREQWGTPCPPSAHQCWGTMPSLQLHPGLAFCLPHTPHGVIMHLY